MGRLSDLALRFAPTWAAKRERSRLVAMHYRAARLNASSDSLRASRSDADGASRDRERVAAFARDLIRNTPFATRAQQVIASNVVGDGIIPKVEFRGIPDDLKLARLREKSMQMIEDNLDTTSIDAAGLQNLYGLQRLAINTIVDAGEVLVRRHHVEAAEGKLPIRIEILEPDYLDGSKWGAVEGGGFIRDGIEYDAEGRRIAYWLYTQHPGGDWLPGLSSALSERVPAADICHVFRVDRPGQSRGVS